MRAEKSLEMGKIKTDMKKLVNKVHSSAKARHAGLRQTHRATHALLASHSKEQRDRAVQLAADAKALGKTLARQTAARKKSASDLKSALGKKAVARKAALSVSRHRSCARLGRQRAARLRAAQASRQSAQTEVRAIQSSVAKLRGDVQAMMQGIASDVAEATRMWRGEPQRQPARPKRAR